MQSVAVVYSCSISMKGEVQKNDRTKERQNERARQIVYQQSDYVCDVAGMMKADYRKLKGRA